MDLHNPPFYDQARASPTFKVGFNQLFTTLLGLILTRITKIMMGIFAPDGYGRSLEDIFDMKMPAFADDDDAGAISVEKRHLVSPELMAYLTWLIYTSAFKERLADARGATHIQFDLKWTETLPASKTCTARSCLMRCRFGLKVSRQARSVALVCWQRVLEFQ